MNTAQTDKMEMYIDIEYLKGLVFILNHRQQCVTCPDGTILYFEDTECNHDDNRIELYAEWNDIGISYYPLTRCYTLSGQDPTYPSGVDLTEIVSVHTTA